MMKKFWRGLAVLVTAVSVWAGVAPITAVQAAPATDIDAKAALAVDLETGKILYDKDGATVLPIASMTKMVSIYLVLEAIKDGKVKWTDTATPDEAVYKISQIRTLSNVPLRADGSYSVKELYQASLIYSANAAMMMLGDIVAGSQTKFIDQMNAKLKTWGITDAKIVNATGLNNSDLTADVYPGSGPKDENEMSAQDLAKVATHLLRDFPEVLETTAIPTMTFREGTSDATKMDNYDWMVKGLVSAQGDLPVDGLKTGTTDAAGPCFTGTVKKDGHRIITVVLHANGTATTTRFDETAKLMRYALNNWTPLTVATKGKAVAGHKAVTVDKGKDQTVPVGAASTTTMWVPTGTTKKDLTYTYKAAKNVTKNTVSAPISKNATVGTVTVKAKRDSLGYLDGSKGATVTLKTQKADEKANFFALMFRGIGDFFSNLF